VGAAAGSTPAILALPVIFFFLVLFLGYLKLKFSTSEQVYKYTGKEKGGYMVIKEQLRLMSGSLFDTLHGLGLAGMVASAVP
jgi:hypothetical protein